MMRLTITAPTNVIVIESLVLLWTQLNVSNKLNSVLRSRRALRSPEASRQIMMRLRSTATCESSSALHFSKEWYPKVQGSPRKKLNSNACPLSTVRNLPNGNVPLLIYTYSRSTLLSLTTKPQAQAFHQKHAKFFWMLASTDQNSQDPNVEWCSVPSNSYRWYGGGVRRLRTLRPLRTSCRRMVGAKTRRMIRQQYILSLVRWWPQGAWFSAT